MNDRVIRPNQAGLAGIGKKSGGLLGANQNKMPDAGERSQGMINKIRQERNRMTSTTSLDQTVKRRRNQSCLSQRCNPMGSS
jgi:hypothetical protein